MATIPASEPMENPLGDLDPADLLKQGAADDTLMDGAPPSFSPPTVEELTQIFPQFEILELIGQGGMGAVYKVRQKDLDRVVALKILPPGIGQSPEFSDRFTREARALAKLNHPGIVTLHEFGQQDGLYFILMEFVDGVNLAQLMKTGRVSPREALAIVPQICDALQYAHDQGIVHRDIKPENLLLDRHGRVKVADFGIAKVVASVSEAPLRSGETLVPTESTLAGKIIGTPQYMAPEQIDHPSEVDHRADIYALGVVFYQMLTGELPGKNLQAPSRKVHIDVRLDEIVLRAMEKQPELRYQTAHEFRTIVDGFQEHVQPPSLPLPKPKRGMLKRWWWVFLVMFPLGLLIGVAGGSVWAYITPKIYESSSTIEVRPKDGTTFDPDFFANQFEAIKSRDSLAAVAEQLELPNKWMLSQDSVVQKLTTILYAKDVRGTDLITVSVRHTDKQEVAAIVSAVVANYQRGYPGTVVIHEEPSEPQTPVSPNVRLILVLSGLLGLVLSPLLALVLITILQRLFPETKSTGSSPQAGQQASMMKTRVDDLDSTPVEAPQQESESPARKRRLTPIMILALGSGALGLICNTIWLLLGHKDSFPPTIFVFTLFGIGLIAIASRPGPKRLLTSTMAVCTVLATLGFILYVHRGGVSYPGSSMSSAYKAPVMGRVEFRYKHPDSTGGGAISYPVKRFGDTQWKPSLGQTIGLKGGRSLSFKTRVDAMRSDSPVAMVTTSSDNSNWETKALKIDGKDALRQLVFSNGLRVEIHWTPADSSMDKGFAIDPIQQQVMLSASRESDQMHPLKVDEATWIAPPALRFVGLQYPSKERWHPDGSLVTDPHELALMREIGPIYAGDMSKGESIRGMEFWFSHPLLESWHITEVEFLDESGTVATKPNRADGKNAETFGKEGRLHWSIKTTPADISKPLNVRLNYTLGPLERVQEHIVEPNAHGSTFNDRSTFITSVGETVGGQAFLALAVDEVTQSKHRFGVEAVTKNGAIIQHGSWHSGGGNGRTMNITFEFGAPISDVAKFRIGTRRLRSVDWKNVAVSGKNPGLDEVKINAEDSAGPLAEAWLANIDAEDYARSWNEAALFFQKSITAPAWNDALMKVRKPLGTLKSRKIRDVKETHTLPGTPDGKYRIIQFDTSFTGKAEAVETVAFMLEKDGSWKVCGYFIR